jgi:hypothetical protein
MIPTQANLLPAMTVKEALGMAFRAGEAHLAGSHCSRIQTHLGEKEVVNALLNAIEMRQTMNQPTELQRARWWRDGWGRAYNKSKVQDRITERRERGEVRAALRWARSLRWARWKGE